MVYFSFYISVAAADELWDEETHCLQLLFEDRSHGVYVACKDPSIIALNTIVGTLAVREQAFMYMILYGQGSRELETYLPTSDIQVTISQNFNKYQLNLFMLSS